MCRFHVIATAMVVVISASATAHFSVNTVVAYPCTVSASMTGTSAVACGAASAPLVSYATSSDTGDMIMTVEF